jgi:GNAT superfamily N-acetyltransferase
MDITVRETSYEGIAGLAQEVVDSGAFVERVADEVPFVLAAPEIFAGQDGFRIFAVEDAQSQPMGFVMVVPGPAPGVLEIGPTYVARSARGQGLGKALVAHAIRWARSAGARRLLVATWGQNARARHVFEDGGFAFLWEEPSTRANGDSTVHFELALEGMNT